ncbi:MAG TPA: hypothetical protein VFR86_09715 [Burkholderiaceae bacterium]|nr:hypothetical protein [Burkholderiaceae bacterium]
MALASGPPAHPQSSALAMPLGKRHHRDVAVDSCSAFLVPLYILLHLAIFIRLARQRPGVPGAALSDRLPTQAGAPPEGDEDPMVSLFAPSITYRIAVDPQAGRTVFMQTLPAYEEACADGWARWRCRRARPPMIGDVARTGRSPISLGRQHPTQSRLSFQVDPTPVAGHFRT